MTREQTLFAQIQSLPAAERLLVLNKIAEWLDQTGARKTTDRENAVRAVEHTWGTIRLQPKMARWIAENKALEYDSH